MTQLVTLCSDYSHDLFPDNNGGSFTNKLPDAIVCSPNATVKINELVYNPGSTSNVFEGSNEITIEMSNYKVWGLVDTKIYHSGTVTYEKGTRTKYRRLPNGRTSTLVDWYRVTIKRISFVGFRGTKYETFYTSESIKGAPSDKESATPIFLKVDEEQIKEADANRSYLLGKIRGGVPMKTPQSTKCYIPPGLYSHFHQFQLALVKCINDTIVNMLFDANAHSSVWAIPRFDFHKYLEFGKHVLVPNKGWVFFEEFQATLTLAVCNISVIEKFLLATALRITLAPAIEQQLGLVEKSRVLGAIPFRDIRAKAVEYNKPRFNRGQRWERLWEPVTYIPKQIKTVTIGRGFTMFTETVLEREKPPKFNEITYVTNVTTSEIKSHNFYGVREIELDRNAIDCIWVFCDIIEPSYVNNIKLPLLQLMTGLTLGDPSSYQGNGISKHINKTRVETIKIWITNIYSGKPLFFHSPVLISLEINDT